MVLDGENLIFSSTVYVDITHEHILLFKILGRLKNVVVANEHIRFQLY